MPLVRDTLQERIYTQIRDMILDGDIAPGQLITIQSLADAFGVSAMPVREALKRLTAANALNVVSGRSVGIPKLNVERLVDLRNVRRELEGTAAGWAADHATSADLERLETQLARMDRAVAAGDAKEFLRGNHAFHFTVYRAAGSPTLLGMVESLWLQISPYFNLLHASGNYRSSNIRHRQLFAALGRKDYEGARQAVRDDIEDACAILLVELA